MGVLHSLETVKVRMLSDVKSRHPTIKTVANLEKSVPNPARGLECAEAEVNGHKQKRPPFRMDVCLCTTKKIGWF